MSDTAKQTDESQDGGTQTGADKKTSEDKSGTQTDTNQKPSEETTEKTFTQAELNSVLAKERREWEKKSKEAEDRAKLSEDERVKAELEAVRRENQMLKAESVVMQALQTAEADDANLLFAAAKDRLEFDKDGKVANVAEIINDLKLTYPKQFGTPKPESTIDGGKGNNTEPKGKPENLSAALKNFYQKK